MSDDKTMQQQSQSLNLKWDRCWEEKVLSNQHFGQLVSDKTYSIFNIFKIIIHSAREKQDEIITRTGKTVRCFGDDVKCLFSRIAAFKFPFSPFCPGCFFLSSDSSGTCLGNEGISLLASLCGKWTTLVLPTFCTARRQIWAFFGSVFRLLE